MLRLVEPLTSYGFLHKPPLATGELAIRIISNLVRMVSFFSLWNFPDYRTKNRFKALESTLFCVSI